VEKFYLSPEKTKVPEKKIRKLDIKESYEFNYGGSKTQNQLIAIDKAHNKGYFGEGVRIGIFDTGFNVNPDRYEALGVVSDNIIDKWDFINNDSIVGPQIGDPPGQIDHGTSMLSLIAGFKDNELIGPAFKAEFALAKTEIIDEEIMQEEDNWAAAVEWADSCGPYKGGIDIISSSLGYKSFDDTVGYSYDPHMCGDSTIITRAADMAVSKGIVVVTAMGNVTYDNPTDKPDTCIVAPADGDSVISAGAVDTNYVSGGWEWAWIEESGTGAIIGPTFDNRTKPEVCAIWSGYHINPDYDPDAPDTAQQSKYLTGQGTSVSTALLAGGCALILQAHPNWAPMKLRDALLSTASQHGSPDDTLGWGIANIWKAMNIEPPVPDPFENDNLAPPYPNPFRPDIHQYVVLPFNVMNQGLGGTIYIFSISGKKIREINLGSSLLPGRYETPESGAAIWDGKDNNGKMVDSGIYLILFRTGYTSSVTKLAVIR
jgi:serine protease AprX